MTRSSQGLTPRSPPSSLRQMHGSGEILQGRIVGIGSRGEGFFRQDNRSVFVPKTRPGDLVRVRVYASKGRHAFAELIEIVEPSAEGLTPPCRHFYDCGGCDFQQLSYSEQTQWKLSTTQHWLSRSPLAPYVENLKFEVIESPKDYHYRHRARIQIVDGKPAFKRARSHSPVLLEECLILTDGFFESLSAEAEKIENANDLEFLFMDNQLQSQGSYLLEDEKIPLSNESFSQPNLFTNQRMWERIKEDILKLSIRNQAWDLFCGSGNFSLPLKKYFSKVVGVEMNSKSIELAKNSSSEIEWRCGNVEEVLLDLLSENAPADFVLLDPSREGSKPTADILRESQVPAITYVSCQLDSLIRDLTSLVKKGPYQIQRWAVVDLLPQTKHIESIVSLQRT